SGLLLAKPFAFQYQSAVATPPLGRPAGPRPATAATGRCRHTAGLRPPTADDEQLLRLWRQQHQPDPGRRTMIAWPIAELLPHAGDMILLDAVESFDDDNVVTRLTVHPWLLSLPDGSLPAWAGIEIMAQSVAAFAGCQGRLLGLPVELGFLLGTRNYQCNVEHFPLGSELRIRACRS